MVWFKNDDAFYSHPKVLSIPRSIRLAAVGTWTLAGCWSAHHLTDGDIPAHMIEELGASLDGAKALVAAKLWVKTRTGFRFKSWSEYQPTRQQVDEARDADRKRKADYRARSKGRPQPGTTRPEAVPVGHQPDKLGRPDTPTRPDPTRPTTPVGLSSHLPERASDETDDDRARRRQIVAGLGITDFDRVLTSLARHVDRPVTEPQAVQIVLSILARPAQSPAKPQAYVLSSIRKSWAEIQKQLDENDPDDTARHLELVAAGIEPPALDWSA